MTKLQSGHELSGDAQTDGHTNEVGTLFLDATHRLMWQTFVPSYFKIPPCMTKIQSGHELSGDAQTDGQGRDLILGRDTSS
jgi:hypothetical protein